LVQTDLVVQDFGFRARIALYVLADVKITIGDRPDEANSALGTIAKGLARTVSMINQSTDQDLTAFKSLTCTWNRPISLVAGLSPVPLCW